MAHIGRYELVRRVGSGGMAEVWKARIQGPAGFEKFVAIKRILPHLAGDEFLEMFAQEAKLVVRLVHPNIVQVLDFGEADDADEEGPGYFIAMEYVAGQNLAQILKKLRKTKRKAPLEIGLYMIAEMAKALSHAHAGVHQGGEPVAVIHRDISPHNILISYAGNVKVTDFGIAKVANAMTQQTSGLLKGKISYMSPEQARLKPLDARSDIFCLGIILYELLCGERLFQGASPEEVYAQIEGFEGLDPCADQVKDLPTDVLEILLYTLRADPADRYQAALELESTLASLLGPQGLIEARNSLSSLMLNLFQLEYEREMRSTQTEDDEEETTRPMEFSPEDLEGSFPSLPGVPPQDPETQVTDISGRSNEADLRKEPTNVTDEPTRTAPAAEAMDALDPLAAATSASTVDPDDPLAAAMAAARGEPTNEGPRVEETEISARLAGAIPVTPDGSGTARVGAGSGAVAVNESPALEGTGPTSPTGPSFEAFAVGEMSDFEADRPTKESTREAEVDRATAEAILRDAVVPEGSAPKPTPSFQKERKALVNVQKSEAQGIPETAEEKREDTTTVGVFPTSHRTGPPWWTIAAAGGGVVLLVIATILLAKLGGGSDAANATPTEAANATAKQTETPRVVAMKTTSLPRPTTPATPPPTPARIVTSTPVKVVRPPTRRPTRTPPPVTYGSATILAKPWVQVSINGRRIKGETPIRKHRLRTGTHTFVFTNPQRKFRVTRKITIKNKQDTRIFVDVTKKRVSIK